MTARTESDEKAFQLATAELDQLARNAGGGAEGLDRASCSPDALYFAQIGVGAASRGCSADGWRAEILKIHGPEILPKIEEAEECMRHSGLWPWSESSG